VDGDEDLDVLSAVNINWANDELCVWYESDGAAPPTFATKRVIADYDDVSGVVAFAVADLDSDEDLDVIAASWLHVTIVWFENDGAGEQFTAHVINKKQDDRHRTSSVFAADVDGDGDLDVVMAASNTDRWGNDVDSLTITWYENADGAGHFSGEHVVATTTTHELVIAGADVDGDGDVDVLSTEDSTATIAWYENDGAGSFVAKHVITATNGAPTFVLPADLDDDGDADVLSVSKEDAVMWYENDGDGNFSAEHVIMVSPVATVATGDLDGDQDVDVVSAADPDPDDWENGAADSWDVEPLAWHENLCLTARPTPSPLSPIKSNSNENAASKKQSLWWIAGGVAGAAVCFALFLWLGGSGLKRFHAVIAQPKQAAPLQQARRVQAAVIVESVELGRQSTIPEAQIELHPVVMAEVRDVATLLR